MNDHQAAGIPAGLRRTFIALVTIIAVVMAAAFGLKQLPMAKADPVDVTISDVKITEQRGEPEVVEGNVVDVRMNWEANGPFNAGDTFEVDFPETFKPQSIDSFDLTDENGVVGGTCSVASGAQTLVCTLNEEFVGKENVNGLIGLRAQAEAASEDEDFPFTVRGKQESTPVANVPGGVKEKGEITDYTGVENLEKSAHIASLSDEYLIWDILIPYESFKDADQIVITDTIQGTNHKHVDAQAPDGTQRAGATQRDAQNQQSYMNENFEIVSDQELRITLSPFDAGTVDNDGKEYDGNWEEGQDIYLTYWTQRLNEVTKEGDTYSNNISVNADGNVSEDSASMFWNTDGFGTIEGVNTGSFSLSKTVEVEGGEPCEALEGASYPVNVTITLPAGFEENTYKNSEGRGNREGNVITYTDYVQDGATITGYDRLPAGTTVEFSETQPEIEGVTFQEPVFSQQSITIEDENASNVAVTLTNPAQCTPETPATGSFTVNKVVEGVDEEDAEAFNNMQFPITAAITNAEGESLDPIEGTISVNGEELTGEAPVGATVVITEGEPEGELPEGYTFDGATIAVGGEEVNQFTIAEGEETNVAVTVTNNYVKDDTPETTTDGAVPPVDETTESEETTPETTEETSDEPEPSTSEESEPSTSEETTEETSPEETTTPDGPGVVTNPSESESEPTSPVTSEPESEQPEPSASEETTAPETEETTVEDSTTPDAPVSEETTPEATAPEETTTPDGPGVVTNPSESESEPTSPVTSESESEQPEPSASEETSPEESTTPDAPVTEETTPETTEQTSDEPESSTSEETSSETSASETVPSGSTSTPQQPDGSSPRGFIPWLVLVPLIPTIKWLVDKIPGGSSNVVPQQPGAHNEPAPKPGSHAVPGQPGKVAPAPGSRPAAGQPGKAAPAPGASRAPIQSVPSGATAKGVGVADFIG